MNVRHIDLRHVRLAAAAIVLVVSACNGTPKRPASDLTTASARLRYGLEVIPGTVYADPPLQSGQDPTTIRGDFRLELVVVPHDMPLGMRYGGACLYFRRLDKRQICLSDTHCPDLLDASGAVVGKSGHCDQTVGPLGEIVGGTCWWKPAGATVQDEPCGKHPKLTETTPPMELHHVYSTRSFDSSAYEPRAWRLVSCQWLAEPGCMSDAPHLKRLRWGPIWIPVPKVEAPLYERLDMTPEPPSPVEG